MISIYLASDWNTKRNYPNEISITFTFSMMPNKGPNETALVFKDQPIFIHKLKRHFATRHNLAVGDSSSMSVLEAVHKKGDAHRSFRHLVNDILLERYDGSIFLTALRHLSRHGQYPFLHFCMSGLTSVPSLMNCQGVNHLDASRLESCSQQHHVRPIHNLWFFFLVSCLIMCHNHIRIHVILI